MVDNLANFAYGTVATAPSPATSGTSLVLTSGQGALFPTAPFDLLIWPAGANPLTSNAELARCTAKATDTLTITRAQYGTSARTVVVGDQCCQPIDANLIGQLLAKSDNLASVADAGSSRFNVSTPSLSSAAAVATTNVSLSAPGATIDGYALQTNDEILLTAQTTASQNGIWIWSGASSALVRPNEFPSGGVVKRGRTVAVVNGTLGANTEWLLAAPAAGLTIDTTAQTWKMVGMGTYVPTATAATELGHATTAESYTLTTTMTPIPGLSVPVNVPAGVDICVESECPWVDSGATTTSYILLRLYEDSTALNEALFQPGIANAGQPLRVSTTYTPTTPGAHTYTAQASVSAASSGAGIEALSTGLLVVPILKVSTC
jgi:hypothetical protein